MTQATPDGHRRMIEKAEPRWMIFHRDKGEVRTSQETVRELWSKHQRHSGGPLSWATILQ